MRKKRRIAAVWIVMALCAAVPLSAGADATIAVCMDGDIVLMDREVYLLGVVAAEMPALYEMEALKAQAVAARTRVEGARCQSNPDAGVCTKSACCQGYLDESEQAARWGGDTETYRNRIMEAVEATRGQIMTYEGQPIEVMYHAVSGGYTEDVEQVYSQALPYLRGVPSPGEENASGYETVQTFTQAQLIAAFPEAAVNGKVVLEVLERSASGRVTVVRVGGYTMSGRMLRSALGLKSTNFEISVSGDGITVYQRGYGHGVGMSQAGANAMALAGADYRVILLHYYQGVEIVTLME